MEPVGEAELAEGLDQVVVALADEVVVALDAHALHVEGAGEAAQDGRALEQRDRRARPSTRTWAALMPGRARRRSRSRAGSSGLTPARLGRVRADELDARPRTRAPASRSEGDVVELAPPESARATAERAARPSRGRRRPCPPRGRSRGRAPRAGVPARAAQRQLQVLGHVERGEQARAGPAARGRVPPSISCAAAPALARAARSSPGAPRSIVAAEVVLAVEEVAAHQQIVLAGRPVRGARRRASSRARSWGCPTRVRHDARRAARRAAGRPTVSSRRHQPAPRPARPAPTFQAHERARRAAPTASCGRRGQGARAPSRGAAKPKARMGSRLSKRRFENEPPAHQSPEHMLT